MKETHETPTRWQVHVFKMGVGLISFYDKKARLELYYQAGRLRQMVRTAELARLLKCSMGHASDLRSGRRNLTPEQADKVVKYCFDKIGEAEKPA